MCSDVLIRTVPAEGAEAPKLLADLDLAQNLGADAEAADEFLTIPFEEIELLEPPLQAQLLV